MEATPFRSALELLPAKPLAKWGSIFFSLAATLSLALLAPLVYLLVDLMVYQGRMPEYPRLPPAAQQRFAEEWNAKWKDDADVQKAWKVMPASADSSYSVRFVAVASVGLQRNISAEASEKYLAATEEPQGLYAAVARNQGRWPAPVLGFFARLSFLGTNGYYLFSLTLLVFGTVLFRGFCVNAAAYLSSSAAVEASGKLRRNLYLHSFRLGALAIRPDLQREAGNLITQRVEQIQDGLIAWLTLGFRGPSLAVVATALLLITHFWLGLTSLFLLGAVWIVAGQAAAWFRRDARMAALRSEARLNVLRESLSLLILAKSCLTDRFAQTRVERQLTEIGRAAKRRLRGETISRPTLFTVAALAGVLLAFFAARAVLGGTLSLAGFAVLAFALGCLILGLNRWFTARSHLRRANGAAADVFEFLNRRGESAQAVDAEFLQPMRKKLEILELAYREPTTGRMILDGVSLAIPFGSKAALVCSNPDEALTMAYLFTRFLEPTGGEIRIDAKNTRWVTYESLRTQMAMVLTDHGAFSDTVANNIGLGDPSYTRPQIIEAAKAAHAHQFIQQLPYGYETPLGSSGHSLRPGEEFRIALARALLRDPSILILEEPYEPFDADSNALIDDAMAHWHNDRTLIYLARRKRTIRTADRVFVITEGKVVDTEADDATAVKMQKLLKSEPVA